MGFFSTTVKKVPTPVTDATEAAWQAAGRPDRPTFYGALPKETLRAINRESTANAFQGQPTFSGFEKSLPFIIGGAGAVASLAAPAAAGAGAAGSAGAGAGTGAAAGAGAAGAGAAGAAGAAGMTTGMGTAISSGIGAGASLYGSKKQSQATQQAAQMQAQATQAALDFQKQQEAERVKEYNAQQVAAKSAWDAEQARRAPYRQAAQGAMIKLAQLAGVPAPTTAIPTPSDTPPPGWTPGMASTSAPSTVPMSAMTPPMSQTDALAAAAINQPRQIALGLQQPQVRY